MEEGYPSAAQGGGLFKFKSQTPMQLKIGSSFDRELTKSFFKIVKTTKMMR